MSTARCRVALAVVLAITSQALAAAAATLRVPEEYASLRIALASVVDGDEIVLAPGVYDTSDNWDLELPNMSLSIRGDGAPDDVRLDGGGPGGAVLSALRVRLDSGKRCRIANLSLRRFVPSMNAAGALDARGSGAIELDHCSFLQCGSDPRKQLVGGAVRLAGDIRASVRGCKFEGNTAYDGGGLSLEDRAFVAVEECSFVGNVAAIGGGLSTRSPALLTVDRCVFDRNSAADGGGGGILSVNGRLTVTKSLFVHNEAIEGGACSHVSFDQSSARFEECTITSNYAGGWGTGAAGGGLLVSAGTSIVRCIVRGNCVPEGVPGADLRVSGRGVVVQCCCLEASGIAPRDWVVEEGAQVWTDPIFCGATECLTYDQSPDWFTLSVGSPCSAWSSPCKRTIGAFDAACGADALGVCCIGAKCVQAPEAICRKLDGAYLGDGSACAEVTCVPDPIERRTWGRIKAGFRPGR